MRCKLSSGKTNSAFVFVKPHAAGKSGEKVERLVEDRLKSAGIRVTGNGVITAESIDKNMFIDKHYGAIASKAVVLKPSELNVPEKGKKQFQEMFGMSWEDAIAQVRLQRRMRARSCLVMVPDLRRNGVSLHAVRISSSSEVVSTVVSLRKVFSS